VKFRLRMTALGSLWVLLRVVAFAQNVSLEVQPGSITSTSSDFTAQVRVVLKNPTAEVLTKVSLIPFSNDGIQAKLEKPSASNVAAKSEIVWPVNISVPRDSHLPGSIDFEATYATGTREHHVFASLPLTSEGEKKFVEASLEGNLEAVSQQRPGLVYVVVANNMDVPLEASIESKAEDCQQDNGKEKDCVPWAKITVFCDQPLRVSARSSAACKVEVRGASRVTPGARPFLVEVNAKWDLAGRTEQRHFALTKPVTVGVFFESELLKALGVPSFLVVPGCLIMFTMQLLLSFGVLGLKDLSKLPDLTITTPSFWILSITLSGFFAPIYYSATKVNYLLNYGVDDLRNVWLSSIVVGAVLYLIVARATLSHRRAHVPSAKDNELTTLKKLGNNNLKVLRPKVTYKLNDKVLTGFMIEDIDEDQSIVWVAPPIKVEWLEPDKDEVKGWEREISDIVNGSTDSAAIARVLERAGAAVQLKFGSTGSVPNPYHVKVEAITEYQAADFILS
jgi:hypothetical protein